MRFSDPSTFPTRGPGLPIPISIGVENTPRGREQTSSRKRKPSPRQIFFPPDKPCTHYFFPAIKNIKHQQPLPPPFSTPPTPHTMSPSTPPAVSASEDLDTGRARNTLTLSRPHLGGGIAGPLTPETSRPGSPYAPPVNYDGLSWPSKNS